ncbi:ribonuclease H-like domain-containing protein [Frateuria aurantia]
MSALHQRLRQWQAQSGGRRADPSPAPAPMATAIPPAPSLSPAIRALVRRQQRLQLSCVPAPDPDQPVLPGEEIAPGLRCTELRLDGIEPPAAWIDPWFAGQAAPVQRSQLFHIDTETTGLAGGVGTRAFMIGVADWWDQALRLRQLTLTRISAEPLMLETLAGWLDRNRVLVSYNGKSYDIPLLATRYRLAGQSNPLAELRHLDLLHPVRRRWKGAWDNCRLATTERRLLGVVRDDDLPGSEAPAAWLDYLRHGQTRKLCRVHDHNAQDLASLAGVMRYLSELPAPAPDHGN